MLEFTVWRELACAFVCSQAKRLGWSVVKVKPATSSRSLYVELRCGRLSATVRLSDHSPHKSHGKRSGMFSVKRASMGRLDDVASWLSSRASSVVVEPSKRVGVSMVGSEATAR